MKNIFIALSVSCSMLLAVSLFAQTNHFTQGFCIGGTDWEHGKAVATDANDNVYLVGSFKGVVDFNPSPTANDSLGSNGGSDIFISKLRANGEYEWTATIGGTSYDGAEQIILSPNGNLLIVGYFMGTNVDFDPGAGTYNLSASTSSLSFVLELDTTGTFVMAKAFGGNALDIATDSQGNMYIGGEFYGTVDLDPGTTTQSHTSNGDADIFVLKLTSLGAYAWSAAVGGTNNEGFAGIGVGNSGDVYYAGSFSETVDFDPGTGTQSITSSSGYMSDAFVSKLNSSGDLTWVKTFGNTYDGEQVRALAIDASENVYTSGDFIWTLDLDPSASGTFTVLADQGNNVFLQKLDKNGNFLWGRATGGNSFDKPSDLLCDAEGNIYTYGEFTSSPFDVNPNMDSLNLIMAGMGEGSDVFIQKLDSNGVFKWGAGFGGTWFEESGKIALDNKGALWMIASTESDSAYLYSNIPNPASNGGNDVLLVKYEPAKATIDASIKYFTAPPFDVSFSNNSTDTAGRQWFWNFDDGSFAQEFEPQHSFDYNGIYDVTLLSLNPLTGQLDTATVRIECTGGTDNPCTFNAEILQTGVPVICPTDSFKLTATPGNYTYNWFLNGMPVQGAHDSILYAKEQGFYIALVSNSACSKVSNYFMLGNFPTINPPIMKQGSIAPCSNDSLQLSTPSGFVSYVWSTGATGTEIYTKISGRYTVTATDQNGCENVSLEKVVNASLADVPEICIVGFDPNTNHNVVMWDAINNPKVERVRVYKETHIANQYALIGEELVGGNNYVLDQNSNVSVRQYKYRIAVVDTCGNESPTSPHHKNIHLMVNAALGGYWNLIWEKYEGVEVQSYKIYRGADSTNLTLLTTLPGHLSSFTDINNPPGNIYYMIEAVTATSCGPNGVPKSNTFNTANAYGVEVEHIQALDFEVKVYPNPNKGEFYLRIEAEQSSTMNIQLYNSMGALVYTEQIENPGTMTKQLALSSLTKGVYFVRVAKDNGVAYVGKLVIQ